MSGAPKGMRVQTAFTVVQGVVEAHIERKTAEASRGREFLAFLSELNQSNAEGAQVAMKPTRRKPRHINPGTIEDRVLEIVREHEGPIAMPQILSAKTGAKEHDVVSTVRALVRSGHLEATGGMRARQYHIPGLKMRRPA